MQPSHPRCLGAAILALTIAAGSNAQQRPPTYLYQRLQAPPQALTLSLDMSPGAWRVGTIDGPPAGDVMLRPLLDNLQGIVVAAACPHAPLVDAAASDTCAFGTGEPAFAGIASDRLGGKVLGWVGTGGKPPQRYFGLLAPLRDGSVPGLRVVLKFNALPRDAMLALDGAGATLILHDDLREMAAVLAAARAGAVPRVAERRIRGALKL